MSQSNSNAKGLLDLAVSMTGREVNMDFVQILDEEAFGKVTQLMMESLAGGILAPDHFILKGWCQDDGRLITRAECGERFKVIEIPKGRWKELSQKELDHIQLELVERDKKNPAERDDLIKEMVAQIKTLGSEYSEHQKGLPEARQRIKQMIFVFDRSTTALIELKKVVEGTPTESRADDWLASGAQFFIHSTGDRAEKFWTVVVEDVDRLFKGTLSEMVKHTPDGLDSAALVTYWLEKSVSESLQREWETLGGGKFN